ncbi:hypothetical protein HWX41_09010 [Bacillus paramycoides]|uniref:hypothetical protein n=1 Tax=Bacillus paramycoides TaxID=2026194 RepID=UPI0015BA470B|nr:hypothetical protein [Bacillus paramycoides]NWK69221.1 hypothetical protein [Bacillus paramycoides]
MNKQQFGKLNTNCDGSLMYYLFLLGDLYGKYYSLESELMKAEKILIVEDEPTISDLINLNLKMVNYETIQVYNGRNALELIETEQL